MLLCHLVRNLITTQHYEELKSINQTILIREAFFLNMLACKKEWVQICQKISVYKYNQNKGLVFHMNIPLMLKYQRIFKGLKLLH